MDSDEKILYEILLKSDMTFCVTNRNVIIKNIGGRHKIKHKGTIEIIDYKNYVLVINDNASIVYRKSNGYFWSYDNMKSIKYDGHRTNNNMKSIEYDGNVFIFCYVICSSDIKFYVDMYDHEACYSRVIRESVRHENFVFDKKNSKELLMDNLEGRKVTFKKELVYSGVQIYKRYHEPSIVMEFSRDHLCDLIVISQGL